jgi:hypothetical protein
VTNPPAGFDRQYRLNVTGGESGTLVTILTWDDDSAWVDADGLFSLDSDDLPDSATLTYTSGTKGWTAPTFADAGFTFPAALDGNNYVATGGATVPDGLSIGALGDHTGRFLFDDDFSRLGAGSPAGQYPYLLDVEAQTDNFTVSGGTLVSQLSTVTDGGVMLHPDALIGFDPEGDWDVTVLASITQAGTRGLRFIVEIGSSNQFSELIVESYDATAGHFHLRVEQDGDVGTNQAITVTSASDFVLRQRKRGEVITPSFNGVDGYSSRRTPGNPLGRNFHFTSTRVAFGSGTQSLVTLKRIRIEQVVPSAGALAWGAR